MQRRIVKTLINLNESHFDCSIDEFIRKGQELKCTLEEKFPEYDSHEVRIFYFGEDLDICAIGVKIQSEEELKKEREDNLYRQKMNKIKILEEQLERLRND